jgi:tRNA wybutosine-synthesizing protein 1
MLRGRGGCYKHTFYGIASHLCMEMTPNLACANKCIFCWRHHSNPVGTAWNWKMEDPEFIVTEAIKKHRKMINAAKGIPGVLEARFIEGMNPRHVALSLVGEPIMYPEINKFVNLLHERDMSTFLVTNAQFPEAIASLAPVTQLYVSVDAATEKTLKEIDRPLFRDFWPRFLESLEALSKKGQRTVYRLTLVNEWNNEEIENYAELIGRGLPDFIEVKGVTYSGVAKDSKLTMKNVPWHEEVCAFVRNLVNLLKDYEIACEHEHSNCLLIARSTFKVDGKWHTWIDYEKFSTLWKQWKATGATFNALEYCAPTPPWCLYGSLQQGFDPTEVRFKRNPKNKGKNITGC